MILRNELNEAGSTNIGRNADAKWVFKGEEAYDINGLEERYAENNLERGLLRTFLGVGCSLQLSHRTVCGGFA